jgi:hypothetical protein
MSPMKDFISGDPAVILCLPLAQVRLHAFIVKISIMGPLKGTDTSLLCIS